MIEVSKNMHALAICCLVTDMLLTFLFFRGISLGHLARHSVRPVEQTSH